MNEGNITVNHLNIRPSLSVLIVQLILLNVLTAFIITGLYLAVAMYLPMQPIILFPPVGVGLLFLLFSIQIFLAILGSLKWANEYYELTPKQLTHTKGILFRKINKYSLEHVKYITVNQGLIGKLLNFGTISLHDMRRVKFIDMYLIHNPNRYLEIFEKLDPDIDEVEDIFRGNLVETTPAV